jgi:hypothetical protein
MCVSWLISVYISILNPIRISWLRFLVYDYVCLIKKSKYIFTIKLQCNRGKSSLFDQFTPKLREKLPTVAIHKWKNLLFYTGPTAHGFGATTVAILSWSVPLARATTHKGQNSYLVSPSLPPSGNALLIACGKALSLHPEMRDRSNQDQSSLSLSF